MLYLSDFLSGTWRAVYRLRRNGRVGFRMRSEQVRSFEMGGRAAGAVLGVGAFGDIKVPLS